MKSCPKHGPYKVFCLLCHGHVPDPRVAVRAKYPQFAHMTDAELAAILRQQIDTTMGLYKTDGPPCECGDWTPVYRVWDKQADLAVLETI